MLDGALRRLYAPALEAPARLLHHAGVGPGTVTLLALLAGLGAAVAVATGSVALALGLWGASRVLDGLDGALARHAGSASDLGGYLDFLADVLVYASLAAAIAYVHPDAPLAFLALLAAISVNLTAHLALGTLLEKRAAAGGRDRRTLLLVPGLAEGFESIVAFALMIALPAYAGLVAWAFAALIAASVVQRILIARRVLGGSA